MDTIKIDFKNTTGIIKPMNAVNNGPVSSVRAVTNFDDYKALEIPYARNHDAAFFSGFGGEHTVDVHRIFKNFDADETDPANYIFQPTDAYIKTTFEAGTETFYRLGAAIEHGYKYGTYPPKDFKKWARICEHIIRHYTEGWANGFNYKITYWEIWNEPDCHNGFSNPCWQGTEEEFVEFYCVAAKHLKEQFPHLKIGGPAFCVPWDYPSKQKFFTGIKESGAPLDFYSFHCYHAEMKHLKESIDVTNEILARYDLHPETILNEWNYIRGWLGEKWTYSIETEQGLKGASFVAATMSIGQAEKLDMLMYYDARPCNMNGLFDSLYNRRPSYYAFEMFRDLRRLGKYVPTESVDDVYLCAATDGNNSGVMLTFYSETDGLENKDVTIDFDGAPKGAKVTVKEYNGEGHTKKVISFTVGEGPFSVDITAKEFNLYYISVEK